MTGKFTPRPWLHPHLMGLLLVGLCAGAMAQNQSATLTAEPVAHASAPATSTVAANPSQLSAVVSWGTGFAVAPHHVLTALHVVRERQRWIVGPVGVTALGRPRWINAEIVKIDPAQDLALLRVSEPLPVLKLHPQSAVPIGLEAVVIGFPQPRLQGASRKITQGIINGYRNTDSAQPEQGYLQISAEVGQGNSGGPVLGPDGTVIGMVQRMLSRARAAERGQEMASNVNYAMRSSQLVEFLKDSPAQASLQIVSAHNVLRPYQLYEQAQASVLAVVGLGSTSEPKP